MMTAHLPKEFRASLKAGLIVITAAKVSNSASIPIAARELRWLGFDDANADLVIHARQIEKCDSAMVAGLIYLCATTLKQGREFLICDPSPILRGFLDIYSSGSDIKERIVHAIEGEYGSDRIPTIPPFIASPMGRVDIVATNETHSFEFDMENRLVAVPPAYRFQQDR